MSLRRAALATSAVLAIALAGPRVASAHTFLLGSEPADGQRLSSAPRIARLQFDQPVSGTLSGIELYGARAGRVDGARVVYASGSTLAVALPKLGRDTYLLDWHAVSADDLHPSSGAITFAVGVSTVTTPPRGSPTATTVVDGPSPREIAFRWVDFAALAGLIGALALVLVCLPSARRRGAASLDGLERRLLGIAVIAGTAALWTGVGLLLVQAGAIARGADADLATVVAHTQYGNAWIARELLVAALLAGALLTAVRGRRRWQSLAMLAAAPLLAVALAANSHSASARGVLSVATAALGLHVLAAALWAGGVCALAVALAGRSRALLDRKSVGLLLRSFGGVAVVSVAALAITGIYTAGVDVASPDALVTTLYGRTLLLKTGVFVALGMVGLGNALLVHAGREDRWLPRGIRAEAVLMVAILLPAAVLLSTAPARAPRFEPPRQVAFGSVRERRSLEAGDLIVSLSVKPNVPGTNFVSADVINTRRPAPRPVRSVDIAIARPGSEVAWRRGTRLAGNTWQLSDAHFPRGGRWTVAIRIRRDSLPDQIVGTPWQVPRAPPAGPIGGKLSDRPLSPLANWLAALAAAAAAAGGLAVVVRRMRARGINLRAVTEDGSRV